MSKKSWTIIIGGWDGYQSTGLSIRENVDESHSGFIALDDLLLQAAGFCKLGVFVVVRPNFNDLIDANGATVGFREWRSFDGAPLKQVNFSAGGRLDGYEKAVPNMHLGGVPVGYPEDHVRNQARLHLELDEVRVKLSKHFKQFHPQLDELRTQAILLDFVVRSLDPKGSESHCFSCGRDVQMSGDSKKGYEVVDLKQEIMQERLVDYLVLHIEENFFNTPLKPSMTEVIKAAICAFTEEG